MTGVVAVVAPRRDGLAIALVAAVVYVACGREAWHGFDMLALLNELHRGIDSHPYYGFFPALLEGMRPLVSPFGGGIYHGGLLLSALGSALGIAGVHAAARQLGLPRQTAAFAALVMATFPGVCYFAVVLEVHGHLLAVCGLVWLTMARWAAAPRHGRAVVVGVCLGFAWLAHPIAAMAGAAMLPIAALASPPLAWRVRWSGMALAFVTLLSCLVLWFVVLPRLGVASTAPAAGDEVRERLGRFLRVAHESGAATFGHSLLREWVVPFFPASVVLLGLSVRRQSAAAALATLAATAPFALVSYLLLWVDECGAYVTMAAGPLALTLASQLRATWIRVAYLAIAVGTALWFSQRLQVTPQAAATAAAVQAATGQRAMAWLVGDGAGPDGQVWLTRHPDCPVVVLADLLTLPVAKVEATLALLAAELAARERDGVPTIVTSTTLDTLAMLAPVHDAARTIHAWLLARRAEVLGAHGGVTVFAVRGR